MTETSPLASMGFIRSMYRDASNEEEAHVRTAVGVPVTGVELRMMDAETGEEVPRDGKSSGEVQARGPWITGSYFGREDQHDGTGDFTADGWLKTGDVGILQKDGYVRLVDRTKDLIKTGGEWIPSVQVENEIMAHPSVSEAAVIAVSSAKWMERPLACIVLKPGQSLTLGELHDFLAPRMAKWWLPDALEIMGEIPKTSVGKFSKKDLRAQFSDYTVK